MNKLKEYMLEFGYTESSIDKIVNTYPLTQLKPDTLLKNLTAIISFFILNGYSSREIIKLSEICPPLLDLYIGTIEDKVNYMVSLGYTKQDFFKIAKAFPTIYSYSKDNIKQKLEDMIILGYTKEETIKMTKQFPALFGLNIKNMKQKLEDVIALGYTKEETFKMTKTFSALYTLNIETLKQKLEDIIALGYTREEVIKMTSKFPALFGLNIENIKQKLEFYKFIGAEKYITNNPKNLMQSVNLSYARYCFYNLNGMQINNTNYKKLFIDQKNFISQYKITNKELVNMYSYQEYINKKQVAKFI